MKDYLDNHNDLLINLDIDTPGKVSTHVSSEYWMSPISLKSYEFLMDFKYSLDQFGSYVDFKPSYKFKTATDFKNEEFLKQHCFFKGEYCVMDDIMLSPVSVLEEGIRQICLWNITNDKNNNKFEKIWWNYIGTYYICLKKKLNEKTVSNLDCYEEILETLSVGNDLKDQLKNCIENSYENKNDFYNFDNKLLKKDKNNYEYSQIYLVPAFFINNQLVKEQLINPIVVSAICDKLIEKPSLCFDFDNPISKTVRNIKKDNGILIFCFVLLGGIITLLIVLFFIRRHLNKRIDSEIQDEIQNHVAKYMRIKESHTMSI